MATNILGLQGGQIQTAKPASDVSVQALNQKKPDQVNKSIGLAKEHAQDVLQGSDSTTQQILNQFSEQSAAKSAARMGAEAQRAELSGASESTQNILGQLTNRDIEQQRQAGITQMATDLGARADTQAGQLAQIGQFEEQKELQEGQLDLQKGQLAETERHNKAVEEMNEKIFGSDEKWKNLSVKEKAYHNALATEDLTTAEGVAKLKALAQEAGMGDLTFDNLIDAQFEAKALAGNTKILSTLALNMENYFDPSTSDYNVDLALKDPAINKALAEVWDAENEGVGGEFDPSDPGMVEWAKSKLQPGFVTDTQVTYNTVISEREKAKANIDFGSVAEEQAYDELSESLANLAALGYKSELIDGKWVVTDSATGTVIDAGDMVVDKQGSIYTSEGNNTVSVENELGEIVEYTKSDDGEWKKSDGTGVVGSITKYLDSALDTKDETDTIGDALGEDAPEGYSEGETYYKDGVPYSIMDGKLVEINLSDLTDAQLKSAVNEAIKNPELADSMLEAGAFNDVGGPKKGSGFMGANSNEFQGMKKGQLVTSDDGVIARVKNASQNGDTEIVVEIIAPTDAFGGAKEVIMYGDNRWGVKFKENNG